MKRHATMECCDYGIEWYGRLSVREMCRFLDEHGGDPGLLEGVPPEEHCDVLWEKVAATLERET